MKGAFHFYPCPHCGEMMRSGTLARHEPICIKNPVVYEHIRGVLNSDNSGHGITRVHYLKLSTANKSLPALDTLTKRVSPFWDNILAFFKLSPPLPDTCCSRCLRCGKFIAGSKMAEHQEHCQQPRATEKPTPKTKPLAQPAPVAYAIAQPAERTISLPIPRITSSAPASKWAGLKGYDPTWKAPTGDTQCLVMVQPGERTCLACGETFAPGGYCMRCSTRDDGTRRAPSDMPPSVATADYLRPDEFVTVR